MTLPGRALRSVVLLAVLVGLVFPILSGFWLTLNAAAGVLPAIGRETISGDAFIAVLAQPGFMTSLRLTLVTGLGSTLLALILACGVVAGLRGRGERALAFLLATPHASLAIGLAFLIAPSGWISRLIAVTLTGWGAPPDLATVNDPWGAALILGLLVKEVPFLILMLLAAQAQLPLRQTLAMGRALGHSAASVWIKIILPQIYPLIRLPLFIVLAFALSVVDMAIILGPSNPPTLAVAVLRWFTDPNPAMILPASAGAVILVGLVGAAILAWRAGEIALARLGCRWIRRGGRGRSLARLQQVLTGLGLLLAALGLAALVVLLIWSLVWRWSYPALLPESWSLRVWQRADWLAPLGRTLFLALATTGISLSLAISWLEGEDRGHLPRARWASALVALPLILPQIGFLYGLNVLFLRLGISGGMAAVIWAQALFVFPYVLLALSDPWRAIDPRHLHAAAALGAGPTRRLFAVRLPMLTRSLLAAGALGIAVSVTQYLPTQFMGAGRVATLATEAVTLSSGSDRRVAATYGLLLAGLPLLAYGLALGLPAILFRNRRDMRPRHEP